MTTLALTFLAVASLLGRPAPSPQGVTAVDGYAFGMTREQVAAVASCQPYRQVAATGGLECPNFRLGSRRMTISFVFSGTALSRVQLWFYEGRSASEAREATAAMLAYLSTHGRVRSSEANGPVTPDAILSRLRTMARGAKVGQAVRVHVLTAGRATPPIAHGSVTLARTGFYVFAFLSDSESTRPRR